MDAFIQDQIISKINMLIEIINRIKAALKELIIPQPENVVPDTKPANG